MAFLLQSELVEPVDHDEVLDKAGELRSERWQRPSWLSWRRWRSRLELFGFELMKVIGVI